MATLHNFAAGVSAHETTSVTNSNKQFHNLNATIPAIPYVQSVLVNHMQALGLVTQLTAAMVMKKG